MQVKRLGGSPNIASAIHTPNLPARTALYGVPPTPIQIVNFSYTGRGAISTFLSEGRKSPDHDTLSFSFKSNNNSICSSNYAS